MWKRTHKCFACNIQACGIRCHFMGAAPSHSKGICILGRRHDMAYNSLPDPSLSGELLLCVLARLCLAGKGREPSQASP